MGKNHLNILSTLNSVEIKFISDLNKNKYLSNDFYFSKILTSRQLKLIDAAIISTPTSSHLKIIKKVGKHVKNIFVEKPIAKNFSETKKIIDYAKKKKLNLKVGFVERFNPAIESLSNILKNNKKIISFDFVRAGPSEIKDVDVITDLMVHDIDLSIFFNGKVKKIQSYSYKSDNKISHSIAFLTHYNGIVSRFIASRITQKKIRTMNVTLKNKYIESDLLKKEINIFTNTKIKDLKNNLTFKSVSEAIQTRHKEALLFELQAFIDSCYGKNNKFLSDYQESYEVMRVCEKVKKNLSI
jgi:predicted dehydrogenase